MEKRKGRLVYPTKVNQASFPYTNRTWRSDGKLIEYSRESSFILFFVDRVWEFLYERNSLHSIFPPLLLLSFFTVWLCDIPANPLVNSLCCVGHWVFQRSFI